MTTKAPAATDFTADVEGVGTFTFARRNFRDEMAIQVEYAKLIRGVTPTDWLALISGWIATLSVLTVSAPDGWDIWSLDPLDEDSYNRLSRVHATLREKENSFRRGHGKQNAEQGAAARQDGGVLVP